MRLECSHLVECLHQTKHSIVVVAVAEFVAEKSKLGSVAVVAVAVVAVVVVAEAE
jgi:hypothetical protein